MSNLLSQYIEIFPTAKPRNTQRSSRLLYEDNIANIIRQIVDKPSFIISSKATPPPRLYSSSGSDSFQLRYGDAEFCLYGYYVKIKQDATFTLDSTTDDNKGFINVTATLTGVYDDSNDLYSPLEICGKDESVLGAEPVYDGLQFNYSRDYKNSVAVVKDNNSVTVTVAFSLFSKHNEVYELCPQSYAKMSVGSLFLDGIDGKHS